MTNEPRLSAAASLMGAALFGIASSGLPDGEIGADFEIDPEAQRVWAKIVSKTGDVYEISTRWVGEESP